MRFKPKDVIITLVLIATTLTISLIISASLTGLIFGQSELTSVISIGIIAFITLIFSYFIIDRMMLKRNNQGWQALGFQRITLRKSRHLLWQIPVFYLFSLLAQGVIMVIYHAFFPISLTNLEGTTNSLYVDVSVFPIVFFLVVIFAPLFEEVFLRGALQETLTRRYGNKVAIIVGACIFVLIHAFLIVLAPAYFLFGFFLGYFYYRYQSIYAPLLFHVFINLINVLTVFLATVLQ